MKAMIGKKQEQKRAATIAAYLILVVCGFMLLMVACETERAGIRPRVVPAGSNDILPPPRGTAIPKRVEEVDVPPPPTPNPSALSKPVPGLLPAPLPISIPEPTPVVIPKPTPVPAPSPTPVPTPVPAPVVKQEMPPIDCPVRLEIEGRGALGNDFLMLVKPGEEVAFRVVLETEGKVPEGAGRSASKPGVYSAEANKSISVNVQAGSVRSSAIDAIIWTAPEKPGLQKLEFKAQEIFSFNSATQSDQALTGRASINVMVLYPFDSSGLGVIEGYPVGLYPNEQGSEATPSVQRKPEAWTPPQWFVKVTPEIEQMQVSEHFKLGDFSARSLRGQMHYIVINPMLIDFLESLRGMARVEYGPKAELVILRAFMSPTERLLLSQKKIVYTLFSRYQYGDAAAVAIDLDGSGQMGDLNRDGKLDRADADKLLDLIDKVQELKKLRGWRMSFARPLEPDWPQAPFAAFDLRGFR